MFQTSVAHAMGTGAQGAAPDGAMGLLVNMAPLILMFAVFYFLLIRPQQKKAKEHKQMLSNLKRGDSIITSGGLVGKIVEAKPDVLIVDLGDTKVTVGRGFVSGITNTNPLVSSAKDTKKDKEQ